VRIDIFPVSAQLGDAAFRSVTRDTLGSDAGDTSQKAFHFGTGATWPSRGT